MKSAHKEIVTKRLLSIIKNEHDPTFSLQAVNVLAQVDSTYDESGFEFLAEVLETFFESLLGQPEINTYIEVAAGAALNRLRGVE